MSKDDESWVLTAVFGNTDVIRDLNKNIFSGLVGNRREQGDSKGMRRENGRRDSKYQQYF